MCVCEWYLRHATIMEVFSGYWGGRCVGQDSEIAGIVLNENKEFLYVQDSKC